MRQRKDPPKQEQDPQSGEQLAGLVRQGDDHEGRIAALEHQLAAMKQALAANLGVSFDAA